MTVRIPVSLPKLKAWHRARTGTRRAALPDAKSVKAALYALLADAGLEGHAVIEVVWGEGGFTACMSGEGEGFTAAHRTVEARAGAA